MKIYKYTTLVLALLFMTETTVIINEWYRNKELELTDESLNFLADEPYNRDYGKWVSDSLAKYSLARFKRKRGLFYNVRKRAYGHFFGIDKVRALIDTMDSLNEDIEIDSLKLVGIRVYRSRNEYSRKGDKYDDVFLVPVRANKRNFYDSLDPDLDTKNYPFASIDWEDFDFQSDSSLILNTSAPCPNNCVQ
ncbi:hypothetical protein [uncultured Roseivirga sp.]|uniref:hypothetical protein n=1 Tax=uncultured Roseivirga sp. TaxID=543088 RepID=UPI000D7AB0C7|nr:hypothetical protein [uncultured Roseivirga sp.]PWL30231.1 MAG: hypothetical protein DCO95_10395 [Roseivirga sp. XM-24bin3]